MTPFPKHNLDTSNKEAAELLASVHTKYGFIPDLFTYMAEAPTVLSAYLELANIIAKSSLSAPQAQIIQLAVSIENKCDFCQTAHIAIGKMNNANSQTIDALINNKVIKDDQDRALVDLALNIVRKRGWLDDADLLAFYDAGFGHQQVLEVILCITIKTLSNYTNHLTKPVANPELLQAAAA